MKINTICIIAITLLLFTTNLFASNLVGISCALKEDIAKKQALSDLSSQIYVELSSDFEKIVESKDENIVKNIKQAIKTKTRLPLFAVRYVKKDCKYDEYTKGFEITVFFNEKKAKNLYTQKILSLKREIEDLNDLLKTAKTQEAKYDILTELLTKIESFSKVCTVALFLNVKNLPVISQSESKIKQI